jgi:phospholipase C
MGYYTREDIPIHHMLADKFTVCDHYFASVMGPTVPNRLYWLSASIDPEGNFGGPQIETPLIWPKFKFTWRIMPEVLQQAGVSWKVYNNRQAGPINRVLFDGMVGSFRQAADPRSYLWQRGIFPRYPLNFAMDVAADNLPQVSWVVPPLIECEHPALPVALGAVGIVNLLRILLSNPKVWEKTAVIISYDENGGFFDWRWLAARSMTGSVDSPIANTDTHSIPAASSTVTSPSVHACIAGRSCTGTASELPIPSRSVRIRRLNDASRRRCRATVGSSHSRSIGNVAVGTKRRSGPLSPRIWYARWTSPSLA